MFKIIRNTCIYLLLVIPSSIIKKTLYIVSKKQTHFLCFRQARRRDVKTKFNDIISAKKMLTKMKYESKEVAEQYGSKCKTNGSIQLEAVSKTLPI